jgi:hypothetical protein
MKIKLKVPLKPSGIDTRLGRIAIEIVFNKKERMGPRWGEEEDSLNDLLTQDKRDCSLSGWLLLKAN